MSNRARSRPLAVLVALLAAFAATPLVARDAAAIPVPQHIWYYDGSGNVIGEGEWSCDGIYAQFWGVMSSNKVVEVIECSGPIDPAR